MNHFMLQSNITVYIIIIMPKLIAVRLVVFITVLGDQVVISEPEGNFSQEQFEAAADEVVMLAAGTGKNTTVIDGYCSLLTK